MRKDLKNNIKANPCVQEALSGTTNVVGASVDMQGYDSVAFAACMKTLAASSLAASLKIEESDDDSVFTEVTAAIDLIGVVPAITHDSDDSCVSLGYVGNKRYVRAYLDITANDGTDVICIQGIQGHAHALPVEGN